MNGFTLNIVDVLDILNANIIEPTLYSWGFIGITDKVIMFINTSITLIFSIFTLKHTVVGAVVFTIKFILLIALLVFIRGGIPRYRYDFLTKIGWIKFLSLVLSVFLSSLLLIFLM